MEKGSNINTILIVIILIVIAAVGGAWWYQNYGTPKTDDTSGIEIKVGDTSGQPQQ